MNGEGARQDRVYRSADRALALAFEHIKLIRAVTPTNADNELHELEQSFRRGSPRLPRWSYEAQAVPPELPSALEKVAEFLDGISPLGRVYGERARELCLEAAIIDAVGTPKIRERAAARFVLRTEQGLADLAEADELARTWIAEEPDGEAWDGELTRTCDETDPFSLVSRMANEAGRHRLPMRVLPQSGLASLAATGDGVILVATGKWVTRRDVERTVLHEIAGHALPRAAAAQQRLGIFALGTARGVDDQEGRALLIEESAGFLDAGRRRELGLRHVAARRTLEGQNFVDVTRVLLDHGSKIADAVRIAARVARGGLAAGGIAREIVYLPALLRVRRALGGRYAAVIERMMASGRIAADVAPVVSLERNYDTNTAEKRDVSGLID